MDAYVKMPETYKNHRLQYFAYLLLLDAAVIAPLLL